METYGRIGPLGRYGNLQSYWTGTKLRKLSVVFYGHMPWGEDIEAIIELTELAVNAISF